MSDTALEAWPYSGLARLKPRLASLTAINPFVFSVVESVEASPKVRVRRMPSGVGSRFAWLTIRAAMVATLLAGATFVLMSAVHQLPAVPPVTRPVPSPAWREIVKPVHIYNLEAPDFAGASLTYTARRHTVGGGREDVLALGSLDGERPALRLRIFRRADEPAAPIVPLFAALAHEAAQVGLAIGRSGLPDLMPTRFGRFEVADISLVRKDGFAAPCDGFRLLLDKPALTITGLVCGRHAAPMSLAEVGCLVERLDVASARDDRDLIDFFAASELHRNSACTGMRLGPDGLHAPWLDDRTGPVAAANDKPATTRKRLRHR